jgi:hypothetical protein
MSRIPCTSELIPPTLPAHFVLTPVEHGQGFS